MKKGINNSRFRALPSSVQNNILSNMKYGGKKYAAGGAMPMEQLTEFDEGGRHEENGLGGIPQGMNPEGQMNLVEEGETKFDAENYIYSDSLKVDKELAEAFNLSPKMVGKTFADASKMAGRKKSKREGDAIEMAANEKDLMNLMEAQEAFKQARIEEKLQEIAALDPNALPALMGQGQPQGGSQGDPTMGGQVQGAPMDEMEEMMKQQAVVAGGTGEPMPEEMAMMQQQQDMAMGQQEGMMRDGGLLYPSYYGTPSDINYNPVRPMNEEEAAEWENYVQKKEEMLEDELGRKSSSNLDVISPSYNKYRNLNHYLTTGQSLPSENYTLHNFRKDRDFSPREIYDWNEFDRPPEAEKLGGYLGDGKSSLKSGGYMSRSYAPGGFMGANPGMMNMANADMMNTGTIETSEDPLGCDCVGGGKSTACCETEGYDSYNKAAWRDKTDSEGNRIKLKDRKAGFRGSNKRLPFKHRRALKKYDVNYDHQTAGVIGGTHGGASADDIANTGMSLNYANIDMSQYSPEEQELMKNSEQPLLWANDPAEWAEANPGVLNKKDVRQMNKVSNALKWTPSAKKAGNIISSTDTERFPGLSDKGIAHRYNEIKQGKIPKPIKLNRTVAGWIKSRLHPRLDPMRNFPMRENKSGVNVPKFRKNAEGEYIEGVDKNTYVKFGGNLMQPMNTMGSGGKMCYGCGGAMHAYGGRMNGIQGDSAKYGKWLDIGSKALGATAAVVGNVPGIGTALGAGLGTLAGTTGSLAENARTSENGKVDWSGIDYGDMALQAGVGAASGAMGAAGAGAKLALSTGDQLADSLYENKYEKKEAEHLAILNDPNADPDSAEYINAMNKEQERSKGQGAFGIAGQAIGAAGNILSGKIGNVAENASGDVMDSGIDTISDDLIPEMNFSKYGGNLMRGGGRFYNTGGPLTLKKTTTNPDGTTIERDVTYNSLEELLADAEMVNKYGGQDAIKANFSAHFSPKSAIPSAFTTPIQNIEAQAVRTNPNNIATQENQNAMMSYIEQMKQDTGPNLNEQNMQNISMLTDMRGPNSLSGELEVPSMPTNQEQQEQQQQVIPEEETVLNDPSKVNITANDVDPNEVDIDPNLSNSKKDISFKETPLEFASKMAGPLYNIGSGLLSKPKDYNPDYIPVDAPKLDATESINSIKRNVAGVRRSLDKVGNNPSQLLALAQTGSRLESQAIQEIDNINAKLEFEAEKLNKAEKQKLNKLKKQLEMSLDEAKRKSIQEGIAQFGEIATTNQANKLAQQYASMGVDNIGGVDYKTYPQQLLDLIKENRKKRKAKKNK